MGTIQIKKVEKKVVTGKVGLNEMAEHIMKHGTVYTEDVVIGVITKLKNCIQEMLADGYKVKLDVISCGLSCQFQNPDPTKPGVHVALDDLGPYVA